MLIFILTFLLQYKTLPTIEPYLEFLNYDKLGKYKFYAAHKQMFN